jgi:tRNA/rRNA methyltransferase
MNLGQAVALTLYEVVREAETVNESQPETLATSAELERITASLLDALRMSGYTQPATIASTEDKVRRMIRRMDIDSSDAEVLLGMLRQILWKLDKK